MDRWFNLPHGVPAEQVQQDSPSSGNRIVMALTVLALNLVGEGLSDGLNTRLQGRTR